MTSPNICEVPALSIYRARNGYILEYQGEQGTERSVVEELDERAVVHQNL